MHFDFTDVKVEGKSNCHKVNETQFIFAFKFYGQYVSLASECSRLEVLNSQHNSLHPAL